MLFHGSLSDLPLTSSSFAIAFANITGYSVLSGLSWGMNLLCSQAFGANHPKLLLTLHLSVLFLLCSSLPISLLWSNMSKILSLLRQDKVILSLVQTYILCSLPDLISFLFIDPIRIFLHSQGITRTLTVTASAAAVLHVPVNLLLLKRFDLGVTGVAAASASSNFVLMVLLLIYVRYKEDTWGEVGPVRN